MRDKEQQPQPHKTFQWGQYRAKDVVDPNKLPSNVRTLKDMTKEEIAKLEAQYGVPIRPRAR